MVGIAQPLLSNSLLDWLLGKNFVILKDIYVQNDQLSPHWISSSGLGLSGTWDTEWNAYVDYLYNIVWEVTVKTGVVNANLAYLHILKSVEEPVVLWWHCALWKSNLPGEIKYLCWLSI